MKRIIVILAFLTAFSGYSQESPNVTYVEGIAFKNYTTTQLNTIVNKVDGDMYYDLTKGYPVFWRDGAWREFGGTVAFSAITGSLRDNADADAELNLKQDVLTFDAVPTNSSTNPVESNGVFDAIALKANESEVFKKDGSVLATGNFNLNQNQILNTLQQTYNNGLVTFQNGFTSSTHYKMSFDGATTNSLNWHYPSSEWRWGNNKLLTTASDLSGMTGITPVINTLTSTSTTSALSAAQGKVLQDGKLSLSGGTMSGNIDMDENAINNASLVRVKKIGTSDDMDAFIQGTGATLEYVLSPSGSGKEITYDFTTDEWRYDGVELGTGGGTDDQTLSEVLAEGDDANYQDIINVSHVAVKDLAETDGSLLITHNVAGSLISNTSSTVPAGEGQIEITPTGEILVLGGLEVHNGVVKIEDLEGVGDRMVVAGSDGELSTQAIPSGGADEQTLSLGGTGNKDLSITGGNTVTLPTLANSNQTIATDRDVQITGAENSIKFKDDSGTTYFEMGNNASIEGFVQFGSMLYEADGAGQITFINPFRVYHNASAPTSNTGGLWYDETNNLLKVYDAGWVTVGGGGSAATTTYDNTDSSLIATNVKDALDELDGNTSINTDNITNNTEAIEDIEVSLTAIPASAIDFNNQTENYTLVDSDANDNKIVRLAYNAEDLTLPSGVFTEGQSIKITYAQSGTGDANIVEGSGTSILGYTDGITLSTYPSGVTLARVSSATSPEVYEVVDSYGTLIDFVDSSLGPEELTNGSFATDTDWTKQNGSTISGGSATVVGAGSIGSSGVNHSLEQTVSLTNGNNYTVEIRMRYVSGSGNVYIGMDFLAWQTVTITGTMATYIYTGNTANTNTHFTIGAASGTTIEIEYVSVKEEL